MTDDPGKNDYAAQAAEEMRQTEQEMNDRLSALEERAKKARGVYDQTKPEETRTQVKPVGSGSYKGLGLGLMIAYGLIGTPLVFYGLGYLIDLRIGGVFWRGALTLFGATAALGWCIYLLSKNQS